MDEYSNTGETPRYRSLQSWFAHFKFAFPGEWPIESYIRARRALLNRHGYFGGDMCIMFRRGVRGL